VESTAALEFDVDTFFNFSEDAFFNFSEEGLEASIEEDRVVVGRNACNLLCILTFGRKKEFSCQILMYDVTSNSVELAQELLLFVAFFLYMYLQALSPKYFCCQVSVKLFL